MIAVGLGLVALGGIWREGYTGAGKAVGGVLLGALMLAGPLWSLPSLLALPRIHEVSTDVQSPPAFDKLARAARRHGQQRRRLSARGSPAPGQGLSRHQAAAGQPPFGRRL